MGADHYRRQLIASLSLAIIAMPTWAQWRAEVETSPLDGANAILYLSLEAAKPPASKGQTIMIRCRGRES